MVNVSRIVLAMVLCLAATGCYTQRAPSPSPPVSSTPEPEQIPPGYVRSYVVFGKRYYVMGSSAGYRETGTASWYGPKFNGKPTANGETYDMHQMTAAHKSLPLPTTVRVTNLDNQQSVVVRVNDRGPFVGERIIDMSFAAATALGMVGPGTAPVEVVALDAPTLSEAVPEPAAPTPSPATISAPASSFIQVGSFSSLDNASKLVQQLLQSGFQPVFTQEIILDNRSLYRVKIGPLNAGTDHATLLNKLELIGQRGARIVSQ